MKYSLILAILLITLPPWFLKFTKDNLIVFSSLSYYGSDFDGDKRCDFSVWDPNTSTLYFQLSSNQKFYKRQFFEGGPQYQPVFADFDGDKNTDFAFYQQDTGLWVIYSTKNPEKIEKLFLGSIGDLPVPTDVNGIGSYKPAVWRPNSSVWLITELDKEGKEKERTVLEGSYQDSAFSGDYDGDGKSDLIVWRPDDGFWHIVKSSTGFDFAQSEHIQHGKEWDVVVPNDYDANGRCDLVFWRPDNQVWYFEYAGTGGKSHMKFGYKDDIPLSCDVDGDTIPELVTWSRNKQSWNVLNVKKQESFSYKWEVPSTSIPTVSVLQYYE